MEEPRGEPKPRGHPQNGRGKAGAEVAFCLWNLGFAGCREALSCCGDEKTGRDQAFRTWDHYSPPDPCPLRYVFLGQWKVEQRQEKKAQASNS